MADLQLKGIGKRFGDVQAVRGLTLDIASGEFIVLLGPSGAGKTTTLRLVAGLERPDAGTVHIGGHDVTALAPALRDVTFVFQQYSLYPHLNVYDNLAFPLRSPMRRTSACAWPLSCPLANVNRVPSGRTPTVAAAAGAGRRPVAARGSRLMRGDPKRAAT